MAQFKTVFEGGDAEKESQSWYESIPLIDDPLEWQEMMDNAPASINMRDSARFWKTVKARGISVVNRDGAPEFSRITFDLGDGIGLQLFTRINEPGWEEWPFIDFRFVKLDTESVS